MLTAIGFTHHLRLTAIGAGGEVDHRLSGERSEPERSELNRSKAEKTR
jgi:hypothetical protein